MREIVHLQAGQCGNQIGAKVRTERIYVLFVIYSKLTLPVGLLGKANVNLRGF